MRIAMITNNYRPFVGGVPVSVERQAQELVRAGHEVTVFAPSYEGMDLKDEGAPERVVRYRSSAGKMKNGMVYPPLYPPEIFQTFEKEAFDCIHVHHPMFAGQWALYLGRKYDIPVIYTYHTKYEDYIHYLPIFGKRNSVLSETAEKAARHMIPKYMKWFANQCDLVFAPSKGIQAALTDAGVVSEVEVFPTGLAEDFFVRDVDKCKEIRKKYGKGKPYMLITVSRLEEEKNYGFLFRGIAELKHRIGDCFELLVVGDGSQASELRTRVNMLEIADVVTFTGNVKNEEVKHYLGAADAFVFASRSETQGIVLAEAMAAGCPVTAVRATGTEDIVKDGINGFLTEENEAEWAERTEEILRAQRHGEMRRAAFAYAQNYRASELAVREANLYQESISRKRKREGKEHEGREYRQDYAPISFY